jgi:lysine 6-dehydrogenase
LRIAILGAGLMGRAAAWDLARQEKISDLLLADADAGTLASARSFLEERGISPGRVTTLEVDLSSADGAARAMDGSRAVLSAAPYHMNADLATRAVEVGSSFCDLGGNPTVVDRELELHDAAQTAGITIIPDCGLAPGTSNVLVAALLEKLPDATEVKLFVGGLPSNPKPPLSYKLVFSPTGLINEYVEPCRVLRDGSICEVPPLTEAEFVDFPEPFGTLEARQTSGGTSTLPRTYQGRLRSLEYKTLRYPGHYTIMEGMLALGLLSREPVEVNGFPVSPRQLIEDRLAETLTDDDTDVVLLRATARSDDGAVVGFRMIDRHDQATGLSAMQRTTSLPAAITTLMLADGTISTAGALPPEKAVRPGLFLQALAERGIRIESFQVKE